jgi:hypothetical protein
MLYLLRDTLASKERTANARDLLASGSKAIARIAWSVGIILLLVVVIVITLIYFGGLGSIVGAGVAMSGTAAIWVARRMWRIGSAKKAAKSTDRHSP